MLAANCAKLTVAQLLKATLDYGIIRLIVKDLQSSQETRRRQLHGVRFTLPGTTFIRNMPFERSNSPIRFSSILRLLVRGNFQTGSLGRQHQALGQDAD
jgi:hypothetical protein